MRAVRAKGAAPNPDGARSTTVVLALVVVVDSIFFAALAPMLPYFQDRLAVSEVALGVLSGAYAAGTLAGSFPAGWLLARWGCVRVITVGLALLCSASLVFAFADDLALLVAARFVQGLGGACSWIGALTWAVSIAAEDRRGRAIGNVMGVGFAGALLGPVAGTVAREYGLAWPFTAIAVLGSVLIWAVCRLPAPRNEGRHPPAAEARPGQALEAARRREVLCQGATLMFAAATVGGALYLVVPVRLDDLGGGGVVLGGAFLIAGALQAAGQRALGGITDSLGPRRPILGAFLIGSVLLIPVAMMSSLPAVVTMSVIAIVAFGIAYTPATSLLYQDVGDVGARGGFAAAIVNLTWAGGQAVGAMAAGLVSGTGSQRLAFFAIATLGMGAAIFVSLRVGRAASSQEPVC